MADVNQEVKELKEKIEFCSYVMKYGRLIDMSSDQTVKAFKLKCELEDELRFIELKNKNEKLKIKHIEEDYIYYLKENTYKEEELDSFLNKNDISSNEVVINSNEICITKKVPSNFGKIINKNTYQIKVCTNKK